MSGQFGKDLGLAIVVRKGFWPQNARLHRMSILVRACCYISLFTVMLEAAVPVITEFPTPTPTGFPDMIATGADGNLWFTEQVPAIGRITPSGTITEFPIDDRVTSFGTSSPYYITGGPDGNLWFTDNNDAAVYRITTAGVITRFPVSAVKIDP